MTPIDIQTLITIVENAAGFLVNSVPCSLENCNSDYLEFDTINIDLENATMWIYEYNGSPSILIDDWEELQTVITPLFKSASISNLKEGKA